LNEKESYMTTIWVVLLRVKWLCCKAWQ